MSGLPSVTAEEFERKTGAGEDVTVPHVLTGKAAEAATTTDGFSVIDLQETCRVSRARSPTLRGETQTLKVGERSAASLGQIMRVQWNPV